MQINMILYFMKHQLKLVLIFKKRFEQLLKGFLLRELIWEVSQENLRHLEPLLQRVIL